jgi:tetraacyldisaccharide 4'-kinase
MKPFGDNALSRIPALLFLGIVSFRNFLYDRFPRLSHAAGRPVISIGGLTAGGSGKTPMALLVGRLLKGKGRDVVFLSRGYHRQSNKTIVCEPRSKALWTDVGDEPALLHANIPDSWLGIGSNRLETIGRILPRLPEKAVFVLDDGFQHRRVKRDADVLCLSVDVFDDFMLPAGMLREPLKAMNRAHCICIVGSESEAHAIEPTKAKIRALNNHATVAALYQQAQGWVRLSDGHRDRQLPGRHPLLLSGIARPQRFTSLVRSMGITPEKEVIFDDHHAFAARQIQELCKDPYDCILTTEKDAHRLLTLNLVNCPDIWYLKMDLQFFDQDSERAFYSFMNDLIS